MRRIWTVGLCVVLGGSLLFGPSAAGPADGSTRWAVCGEWRQVPVHGDNGVHARDVAVVSPTDAWLTGTSGELFWRSSVFRWTGLRWSQVPFPVPNTGRDPEDASADDWWLGHLAVISPDEVWAVGGYTFWPKDPGHHPWLAKPLIARWDGTRWQHVPVGIPKLSGTLYSVASIPGTDDLWAVGVRYPHGNHDHPLTLVLRWDGSAWHRYATPNPSDHGNLLHDVAVADGTAWAVGLRQHPGSTDTLILRWTGGRWVRTPAPTPGLESSLDSVAIGSADHAWAVGTANLAATTERAAYRGFVLRWNGTAWRASHVLDRNSSLLDVVAASPTDIWAVGSRKGRALVLRKVGTEWRLSAVPDLPGTFTTIDGTPHNLWVGHSRVLIDTSVIDTYHRC